MQRMGPKRNDHLLCVRMSLHSHAGDPLLFQVGWEFEVNRGDLQIRGLGVEIEDPVG